MPTYRVQKASLPPDNTEFVRIPRRRDVVAETLGLSVASVLLAVDTVLSLYGWWGDAEALGIGSGGGDSGGTRGALTEDFAETTTFSTDAWNFSAWIATFVARYLVLGHAWSYTCRQNVYRASSPLLYPVLSLASLVNVGYVYAVGHDAAELALALVAVETLALGVSVAIVAASLRKKETGLTELKRVDKWLTRILVMNALVFSGAWTLLITLFHLAVILGENTLLHDDTITTLLLSLLSAITVGYFFLEATILDRYLRCVFVVYPIAAWFVGGVLSRHWNEEFTDISRNDLFAFVLLLAQCGLFLVRLVLMVLFGLCRSLNGGGGREDTIGMAQIPYS